IEPGHATTEPLIVAVTVTLTVTVCSLPDTVAPVLSVAVIVMVPVYVPGWTFTAEAFTPNELPAPLSIPEVEVSTSQELLFEACQVTGRAQVPLSLSATFNAVAVACPCVSEKASVAGEGDESRQGGRTVMVAGKV